MVYKPLSMMERVDRLETNVKRIRPDYISPVIFILVSLWKNITNLLDSFVKSTSLMDEFLDTNIEMDPVMKTILFGKGEIDPLALMILGDNNEKFNPLSSLSILDSYRSIAIKKLSRSDIETLITYYLDQAEVVWTQAEFEINNFELKDSKENVQTFSPTDSKETSVRNTFIDFEKIDKITKLFNIKSIEKFSEAKSIDSVKLDKFLTDLNNLVKKFKTVEEIDKDHTLIKKFEKDHKETLEKMTTHFE